MVRAPGIQPRPSLGRRLDAAARQGFPGTVTALLLVLAAGPLGLPGQAQLQGALALGSVFFWSLARPAAMPPALVFGLGLLADLLGCAPVGSGVLALLIGHAVARQGRGLAGLGLLPAWLAFAAVAAATAGLQWGVASLLDLRLMPAPPALFQATLSVALYPPLAVVLGRADRWLGGAAADA